MGRKLLLLNLLMVVAIVLLAQQLVASWSYFRNQPKIFSTPAGGVQFAPLESEEPSAPLSDFLIITERNLFSENRGNEPPPEVNPGEDTPPEFTTTPKLLSVSAVRGVKQAVLTIFSGRRGRESENRTVKLGDDVEGYEVSEIGRDYLILRWKEVEEMIELTREKSASGNRPSGTRQAVKIITVGAAAAAVETTTSEAAEDTERGLQVASVGSQQQGAGARRGGAGATGLQGGRGGLGNQNSRGGLGGRGGPGRNNQQNNRGGNLPGTVGLGGQRPLPQQPQPPR